METISAKDGTILAYDRFGSGPSVVLVDGALCSRQSGPNQPLAKLLSQHFTVFTYDRRGRGDSGEILPYAVEREIEDLHTIIEVAGGTSYVYGISSGAALALEATRLGAPVTKLAIFEPPFVVADSRKPIPADWVSQLHTLVSQGERGAAVKYFMRQGVGLPAIIVALMQLMPSWSGLKNLAHTLPYDAALVDVFGRGKPLPSHYWSDNAVPTLVLSGEKSQGWIRKSASELAQVIPHATYQVLARQTHVVKAEALAPALTAFFTQ